MFGHRNLWNRILGTKQRTSSGAPRKNAARPQLETLEDRVNPVSVNAAFVDIFGTLHVNELFGVGGSNLEIKSQIIGSETAISVIGHVVPIFGATTVNGVTEADFDITTISKISVALLGDSQILDIHDLSLVTGGGLTVTWGAGSMAATLDNVNLPGVVQYTSFGGGKNTLGVDVPTVYNPGVSNSTIGALGLLAPGAGAGSGETLKNLGGNTIIGTTLGGGAKDSFSADGSTLGFVVVTMGGGDQDSAKLGV